jgi:hypothetical protein
MHLCVSLAISKATRLKVQLAGTPQTDVAGALPTCTSKQSQE